ncbi:TlpA family protein disulfide reductase [Aestuariibaculum suncheonense]|uniref:TlpA family protein disulfide reductase n=1 Tax=Aestuariibaculum suncheonense TaxID=1028745 RepID=A0A8J6QIH2_9FLAO|nr:TlpA disulfide reductase family protein [Aestuariibaculum suncheonense]MBD0835626.1 TlpA family protein disulfide reductase [Aestuariibaculum suncheonense]
MRRLFYVFALVLAMASCDSEQKKDFIVFKGKVVNPVGTDLRLSSLCYANSKNIPINEDGTFLDTLYVQADNLMLYHGGHLAYMYLEAGDDISLSFDTDDFNNSIKFEGKGAHYNNYLLSKKAVSNEILSEIDNIYLLNETEFKQMQKKLELALLEHLERTKNFPQDYIQMEKRNIEYGYLSALNNYESNHAYYGKNPEFEVSNDFLKELEVLDYNNAEDYVFSNSYNNLVGTYCSKYAKKLTKSSDIDYDVAYLKAVNTLSNQTIKNIICYKSAKYGITYTSDLEGYYAEYVKGSADETNNKEIEESYQALRTVAKGQPSPKFMNYENVDGTTTSLDDLKGKYVYIDVWATWCGPCKAEIPFLKEVEKEYHDKNIEFVSISVDTQNNRDKWKEMVEEKELGGIQLLADHAFDSKFVQDYLIKGIPRFILLDPQGNIVTANAPRPSNEKLVALFNELKL